MGRRWKKTAIAAICAGTILVTGTSSVLAANTSVLQKIKDAFSAFGGQKQELTQEQAQIYETYADPLKQEIKLDCGTLRLEAMINDGHLICIPFSIDIGEGAGKPGEDIMDTPIYNTTQDGLLDKGDWYLEDEDTVMTQFTTLQPQLQEDGKSLAGAFLLYDDEKTIKQGQVIRLRRAKPTGLAPGKTICKLTVNTPMNRSNVPVDLIQKQIPKEVTIDRASLTPVSLHLEGTCEKSTTLSLSQIFKVTIELKNGHIIKAAQTGPGYGLGGDDETSFHALILFNEPFDVKDVKTIHIPQLK